MTPSCVVQEVGIHVMAPIAELAKDPLPRSVAIQPLREVATATQNGGHSLPEGAGRFVVTVDGTESEEQIQVSCAVGETESKEKKEKDRKDYITPFGVSLMRSKVLYLAAQ